MELTLKGWNKWGRHIVKIVVAGLICLSFSLLLPARISLVATANPDRKALYISLSKDSYWYQEGQTAHLDVTLDNRSGQSLKSVDIVAKMHPPNKTRESYDLRLDGKLKTYTHSKKLARNLSLRKGSNKLRLDFPLDGTGLGRGVNPLTLEVVKSGSTLCSGVTDIVVMSPSDFSAPMSPLKTSLIFDLSEPPHKDTNGAYTSDELSRECKKGSGWYANLASELEARENMRISIALSPLLVEEMEEASRGYIVGKGKEKTRIASDSPSAKCVSSVIASFKRMAKNPRFQFLQIPWASPNLEQLVASGLAEDARAQLSLGRETLERVLGVSFTTNILYPPGLELSSRTIEALENEIGTFFLASPSLLGRTRKGEMLARGLTVSNPVWVEYGEGKKQMLGIFSDQRLEELLERLAKSDDPHGVAQCILSELTNLYLERPASPRGCAIVWPSNWRPPKGVLEEVMEAISGCPWLLTTTAEELFSTVPAIEEAKIEIPQRESEKEERGYFANVKKTNVRLREFSRLPVKGAPILERLYKELYVSESDIWRQWGREKAGLAYAEAVLQTIEDELEKIDMPDIGAMTLTSKSAEIPLTITNRTDYKIRVRLQVYSDDFSFPKGRSMDLVLDPRENLIEIPVVAKREGRLRFSATLFGGREALSSLEIAIKTGGFNTFGAIFVGAILGIIAAIWTTKVFAMRRAGKHKKHKIAKIKKQTEEGKK